MPRKYGRITPPILPHDNPNVLRFGAFLKTTLRPPPLMVNWAKSGSMIYPMDLNDQLGTCGPASLAHALQDWSAWTMPNAIVLTDQNILTIYEAVGGYKPSNPATDGGVVLSDLWTYWKQTGVLGNKLAVAASVPPNNPTYLQWAIECCGGVVFGVQLPQSAEDQTDANQPWTVVPGSPILGGHAIWCNGYDPNGYHCISWGERVTITQAFITKYTEEIWCLIDAAWFDQQGLAPNLLNITSITNNAGILGAVA